MSDKLAIVFDGPPSHESGRFVEVELNGASISFGEWQENGEFWELVLPDRWTALAKAQSKSDALEQRVEGLEESNRVAIKIIQLARSVADIPAWVGKLEAHLGSQEEA